MQLMPIIDPKVLQIAPDFRAHHVFVTAPESTALANGGLTLDEACRFVLEGEPSWAEAHLAAWADTYRRFGARPNRTPCSAQALRKRVLKDGMLPTINPVVDLYNAVSLRFAVPVGGENLGPYVGVPRLTVADGSEVFDTFANGAPSIEHPEPGEIIWRDDRGVTCRRWNWRQGARTRLNGDEQTMWFVLERLGPMPAGALTEAGDMLEHGLAQLMPGCIIDRLDV